MAFIDYYQTLGVPKTATDDEIKKAYRKLAAKLRLAASATGAEHGTEKI